MRTLVRATNWVGDAVMNLPAMEFLKSRDSEGHLCVLAVPWVADVFRNHPAVDEIVIYDRKGSDGGMKGIFRKGRSLRRMRFDRAYILPNSFSSALLPFLAGIPQRIGFPGGGRDLLLTKAVKRTAEMEGIHQSVVYRMLAGEDDPGPLAPRVHVTADEARAFREKVNEAALPDAMLTMGVCPGATFGPAKRWFPERFAEVLNRLEACTLLFGSPAEREIAEKVADHLSGPALNLAGKTSLRELAAGLKECDVVLTNDTGTMHLAAAVGTPVVAIFGSTNPVTTGPYGQANRVVRHPMPCAPCLKRTCPLGHLECMNRVTVDMVLEAVQDILVTPEKPRP